MRGVASLTVGVLTAGAPEDFVHRPDMASLAACAEFSLRLDCAVMRQYYAGSKRRIQQLISAWQRAEGVSYVWPRPSLPVLRIHSRPRVSDPLKSRNGLAVGLIAVGDIAIGVIAVGPIAVGPVAAGIVAIGGLAAIGAVACAVFAACGVVAIGGSIAVGVVAAGRVAAGLLAVGRWAYGVIAIGRHGVGLLPFTGDALDWLSRHLK